MLLFSLLVCIVVFWNIWIGVGFWSLNRTINWSVFGMSYHQLYLMWLFVVSLIFVYFFTNILVSGMPIAVSKRKIVFMVFVYLLVLWELF